MSTLFARGEVVRASMNAQGLVAGELYTVREIHVHSAGPFGDVTYRVQARKQKGRDPILLDIANGHLFLHGFRPMDMEQVAEGMQL